MVAHERLEGVADLFIICSSNVVRSIESRFMAADLTASVSSEAFPAATQSVRGKASIESFAQVLPVSSASSAQWEDGASCAFLAGCIKCSPCSIWACAKSMGQDFSRDL